MLALSQVLLGTALPSCPHGALFVQAVLWRCSKEPGAASPEPGGEAQGPDPSKECQGTQELQQGLASAQSDDHTPSHAVKGVSRCWPGWEERSITRKTSLWLMDKHSIPSERWMGWFCSCCLSWHCMNMSGTNNSRGESVSHRVGSCLSSPDQSLSLEGFASCLGGWELGREFRKGELRVVVLWPSCTPLPAVLCSAGDSPEFVGTAPVKCTLLHRGV